MTGTLPCCHLLFETRNTRTSTRFVMLGLSDSCSCGSTKRTPHQSTECSGSWDNTTRAHTHVLVATALWFATKGHTRNHQKRSTTTRVWERTLVYWMSHNHHHHHQTLNRRWASPTAHPNNKLPSRTLDICWTATGFFYSFATAGPTPCNVLRTIAFHPSLVV